MRDSGSADKKDVWTKPSAPRTSETNGWMSKHDCLHHVSFEGEALAPAARSRRPGLQDQYFDERKPIGVTETGATPTKTENDYAGPS